MKGPDNQKWLDYVEKGKLGKNSLAPGLQKFRVQGGVCQTYPVIGWH